jgi:uncharacterized protein (TIGR03437 family)
MKSIVVCVLVSCPGFCSQASGQSSIITTVAGNGNYGFSGDGGPATSASLNSPYDVAVDAFGNLYIADTFNSRIRKVSASGIITTVAGNGNNDFSGDGGQATFASLGRPEGVAVDASGNLFIADTENNRIRKVSPNGVITTVAGNGNYGFSGDGGPAASASLDFPKGVVVDAFGNLFTADSLNWRVRKVSANGVITTVAGGGTASPGNGGPATSASLTPLGVAVDVSGNLFIVGSDYRVWKVSPSGIITTVAGNGLGGFSGDGGPATSATLSTSGGIAVDASGNLFIGDTFNLRVRKVSTSGIITTVAGGGTNGLGDDGPATAAFVDGPYGLGLDASGNLFIAEGDGRIREVLELGSTTLPAPSITAGGIVPADSTVSTIRSAEWVSIFGSTLAASAATWNGDFPTSLGGTSVTINGKAAYLSFVSPTQINLQAPNDTATGSVPVVVTTAGGTATSTVTLAEFAPSFLLLDSKHVAGIILRSNGSGAYGGGTYDILGPTGNSLGYATVAAKAGDTIALYAVGLGPTAPAVPAGQAFSGSAAATYPVSLLINKANVIPTFAGLSGAGLYQINLTVPSGLGTGDVSLVASVGGAQTPLGVVISLQ